jgi:hypothetical protein
MGAVHACSIQDNVEMKVSQERNSPQAKKAAINRHG